MTTSKVIISGGREIEIDLLKISIAEYRSLFDPAQKPQDEDVVLCKVFGMELEDYRRLPYPDWKRLTIAFFDAAKKIGDDNDPNSQSESSST